MDIYHACLCILVIVLEKTNGRKSSAWKKGITYLSNMRIPQLGSLLVLINNSIHARYYHG